MPEITSDPPSAIAQELTNLRAALTDTVPQKKAGKNLLLASRNIRAFGSLTRKWTSAGSDSPKRDLRGLKYIAEVISRFAVISVQEIVSDLRALRDLMKFLGDDWAFLMTDVTAGAKGNNERITFIYHRKRVE